MLCGSLCRLTGILPSSTSGGETPPRPQHYPLRSQTDSCYSTPFPQHSSSMMLDCPLSLHFAQPPVCRPTMFLAVLCSAISLPQHSSGFSPARNHTARSTSTTPCNHAFVFATLRPELCVMTTREGGLFQAAATPFCQTVGLNS